MGKEQLDVAPSQDINETIKNNNRIYREKLKENKAAQDDDDEESKAYARLCDFFSEQEYILIFRVETHHKLERLSIDVVNRLKERDLTRHAIILKHSRKEH